MTFNRSVYRVPDLMKLTLVDANLAGQPSATIALSSGTETNAESITLVASSATGLFTGAIATAIGPTMQDGVLQVQHGNLITAVYQDAAPAATRLYTALADLQAPITTNVLVADRFGRATASWTTDEPAQSVVQYGPTITLGLGATNQAYQTAHSFTFNTLPAGSTNYFRITCSDLAGNKTTNDNQGVLFMVVGPRAPRFWLSMLSRGTP